MKSELLVKAIMNGVFDDGLIKLYGEENLAAQRCRYINAIKSFVAIYGDGNEIMILSVPGRSEISGNHTDHNGGCVIAASIDLDIIAIVMPRADDTIINVKSEGFAGSDFVDYGSYTAPNAEKYGTSESLIAGVCHGLSERGHKVGGFNAYTTSNVLKGSGLSSSAAFEVLIGSIINCLYNNGSINPVEIAHIAKEAENSFFGKPCGLMDQLACAYGGIVAIDFADQNNPVIDKIDFDFTNEGYSLCIVDTGGNHADLTGEYASIPAEMKAVASFFGKKTLRELDDLERRVGKTRVINNIMRLREALGDRAVMRALHFFNENSRVTAQKEALDNGDIEKFFELMRESGESSFCYLQNVHTASNTEEQGLSLALCLADTYLRGDKDAAWRVHGGGFAGTIQSIMKNNRTEEYCRIMDSVFGENAAKVLKIRNEGCCVIYRDDR